MSLLRNIATGLRSLVRRNKVNRELDEELSAYLEMAAVEKMKLGMSRKEAVRAVRLERGSAEIAKEVIRSSSWESFVETCWQDLRYAARTLRKSPVFTTVAVLTLALGIGANTAIFSLTDQVLLRLLPVKHPEELVLLRSTEMKWGHTEADYDLANSFSYPMYKNLRADNQAFSGMLTCFGVSVSVDTRGYAQIAQGELVSGNFFDVLGVQPALGRVFSPADETSPGANPVVVLNYDYWSTQFGSDPSILNHMLEVNGYPLTVVGVAQPAFNAVQAGAKPDLYIPITMKTQMTPGWSDLDSTSHYFLPIVARLNPGVTLAQAQASLQPLFHSLLDAEYPGIVSRWGATLDRKQFLAGQLELLPGAQGRPVLQHSAETPLLFLTAMVGLVLLIACTNLACLLLARGESRQHEIAARLALGASRGRVIRQLLTESTLLALAGGAVGLFLGWAALATLIAMMPPDPGTSALNASLDLRVLAVSGAAAILSGIFCGLSPAVRASRASLHSAFKDQGASVTGGVGSVRLRKSLVVAQVAMTAAVLVAAGLFGESLIRTERVNLGMRISHIIQFDFSAGLSRYPPAQTAALFNRLREKLGALPSVSSVTASDGALLAGGMEVDTVNFEGYHDSKDEDINPWVNRVAPNFFSTLGIPLLRGRDFRETDSLPDAKVAIISESAAQKYFAGRNPIGFHFGFGGEVPHIEIIGVVGDVRQNDPRWPPSPSVYLPCGLRIISATFYLRTALPPSTIIPTLRTTVAQTAPGVAADHFQTLTEQLNNIVFDERLLAFLTTAFGLLAALLACVGLYGVMAYVVARRTREIGIRVALGANNSDVLRLVVGQGIVLTAAGVGMGLAGALGAGRFLSSLLYGVTPTDPLTFVIASLTLTAVALLASYIPARRATRVDPTVALRYE
jgi:predicted permease